MSEEKKQQDFVVSDRRRFGSEGELRDDVKRDEEKPAAPTTPPPSKMPSAPPQAAEPPEGKPIPPGIPEIHAPEELPPPPTVEEQHQQNEAYRASGKKLDDLVQSRTGAQGPYPDLTFEKVVESFYMSALIQMGAIRNEGEPPAVDIIGARQTIDSLTILQEKTKGNLTDREQTLLQNALFELRMAWIELTNAIATRAIAPQTPAPGAPAEKK
jgi:hypothetical protein